MSLLDQEGYVPVDGFRVLFVGIKVSVVGVTRKGFLYSFCMVVLALPTTI